MQDEVVRGVEDPQVREQLDDGADAHRLEELRGRLPAALARLVDLASRDRFGERQVPVLDHHAAEDGDEEDAEDAADDHQRAWP